MDVVPLVISTRAIGRRRPLLADFSVDPPADFGDGDEPRLRDLIECVVRQEVEKYAKRQSKQRFDRVLSAGELADGAARGKVDPAGKSFAPAVDPDDAVATALLAFEDGLYLVIIDEVERRDLDQPVRLAPDSRVTFIRLTFLAGA